MSKHLEITGMTFGRLTVLQRIENDADGEARWLCECKCGSGKPVIANTYSLRSGNTKSCGCYQKERATEARRKHGASSSRLWKIWSGLRQRCNNPHDKGYKNWGARGIGVCAEWEDPEFGFENFQRWAMENGYDDTLTIDRVDNDGNYCPENCRWATAKEQGNNKRNNRLIEYNGKTQTLSQWADELGVPVSRLTQRLRRGWTTERAFSEPKILPCGRARSEDNGRLQC